MGSQPVRIFISAGERSGDVHAAHLIRAVKKLRPDVEFEGFGGPSMEEAGCRLHRNMLDLSVMWFSFLGHLWKFLSLLRNFYWLLKESPPAALVLVDYPGLHFILARLARARKVPVVYYICPQIWGWAPWRRGKIIRLTDLLMVILPFEAALYRNDKNTVEYVGHPLPDELLDHPAFAGGADPRETLGIAKERRVVGVFPGSRRQEVRSLMPLFRRILDGMELDPHRHQVVVSCCEPGFRETIEANLLGAAYPVAVRDDDSRLLMGACDFALVASGTATLELSFFRKPMLVLYRISKLALMAYRLLAVNPFISLVNILGRGEVVPEKVVSGMDPSDLIVQARALFEDSPERDLCLRKLERLHEEVFQPGGVAKAAGTLVEFLEKRNIFAEARA